MLDVRVRPCMTTGFPSLPSQQSISMHRQPFWSAVMYASVLDSPATWRPRRYVLCEHEMKYSFKGRLSCKSFSTGFRTEFAGDVKNVWKAGKLIVRGSGISLPSDGVVLALVTRANFSNVFDQYS